MHPRGLCYSSLKYSRYFRLSRLAREAPRPSPCDARGLDRLNSEFLSRAFRSRPSARQRGVVNNVESSEAEPYGRRRSLARTERSAPTAAGATNRHWCAGHKRQIGRARRGVFTATVSLRRATGFRHRSLRRTARGQLSTRTQPPETTNIHRDCG